MFDKEVALHPVIFNFLKKFNQIDHLKSIFSIRALNLKKIRLHVILHRSIKYTGKKQLKKSYRVDTFTRNLIVLQFVTSCSQIILKVFQIVQILSPMPIFSRLIVYLSYLTSYTSSNEIQIVSSAA